MVDTACQPAPYPVDFGPVYGGLLADRELRLHIDPPAPLLIRLSLAAATSARLAPATKTWCAAIRCQRDHQATTVALSASSVRWKVGGLSCSRSAMARSCISVSRLTGVYASGSAKVTGGDASGASARWIGTSDGNC